MKKQVFFTALLCLLFVFQCVSAVPTVRNDLVYNGEMQPLAADPQKEGGFYSVNGGDYWEDIPTEDVPGEWAIYWKATETDSGSYIGTAKILPKELSVKWGETTLPYNGAEQIPAIKVSGCEKPDAILCDDPWLDGFGFDAGKYTATLTVDSEYYTIPKGSESVAYEITPVELNVEWGKTSLPYNGEEQIPAITVTGCAEIDADLCKDPWLDGFEYDAGKYEATLTVDSDNYVIPEGTDSTEFEITPIELNVEWGDTTLAYNGEEQIPSITVTGCAEIDADLCKDPWLDGFEYDAGTYEATLTIDSENYVIPEGADSTKFEITPKELEDSMIRFENGNSFVYDGEEHEAVITVEYNGLILSEGVDYVVDESSEFFGTEAGKYTVTISAAGEGTKAPSGGNYSGQASASWSILAAASSTVQEPAPSEPSPAVPVTSAAPESPAASEPSAVQSPHQSVRLTSSAPTVNSSFNWYQVGEIEEHSSSFCYDCALPNTGITTRLNTELSLKPAGLNYTDLKMRIQIPTVNLDTELAGVPLMSNEWALDWLGKNAGVLSGSHFPGEGLSVIAAHNTLSQTEIGPFLMLYALEKNDVIFINKPDGGLLRFGVYANELIEPNDMQKLASIAEQEEGTLVLVTCENESAEGGYLNRRVVFAKPLD